ncbi:MAG: ChbG/HpnK family deacetylase [Anaerolineales bacterium]|jgi:hypothetical protein
MNEIRLIVNADDFARSVGINDGILKAHKEGIVSTTTAMMNLENSKVSVRSARENAPTLGIGVHLNITYGSPLSPAEEICSLTDKNGLFRDFHELLASPEEINLEHVEREWRQQIECFLDTGVPLDHLDSHHHSAAFSKDLFRLFLNLASEYGCGVRNPNPVDIEQVELHSLYSNVMIEFLVNKSDTLMSDMGIPHPDGFLASFFAEKANVSHLRKLLSTLGPGVYELMCHPGIFEPSLAETSNYAHFREQELETLTHPDILGTIQNLDVRLHSFYSAWIT